MTNCFLLLKNTARYLLKELQENSFQPTFGFFMFSFGRAYPAVIAIAAILFWSEGASAVSCPDLPSERAADVTAGAPGSCLSHDGTPAKVSDASHDAFAQDLSHIAIYGVPQSDGCHSDASCDAEPGGKVPLPASVLLFATGLASLGLLAMRRRRPMRVPPADDE